MMFLEAFIFASFSELTLNCSFITSEMTVGKDQEITVKSKGAGGQGKVAAKVTGPGGKSVPCKVEPGLSPETSQVRFIPRDKGPYEVELSYDGAPIPGSPFPVEAVAPTDPSKVGQFCISDKCSDTQLYWILFLSFLFLIASVSRSVALVQVWSELRLERPASLW